MFSGWQRHSTSSAPEQPVLWALRLMQPAYGKDIGQQTGWFHYFNSSRWRRCLFDITVCSAAR